MNISRKLNNNNNNFKNKPKEIQKYKASGVRLDFLFRELTLAMHAHFME